VKACRITLLFFIFTAFSSCIGIFEKEPVVIPQVAESVVRQRYIEARTVLRHLYLSEQGFFFEYDGYWSYIEAIGFDASAAESGVFVYGFNAPPNVSQIILAVLSALLPDANQGPFHTSEEGTGIDFMQVAAAYCPGAPAGECSATDNTFYALAVGDPDEDGNLHVMAIDQTGEIFTLLNDIDFDIQDIVQAELQTGIQAALLGLSVAEAAFFAEYGVYNTYLTPIGFQAPAYMTDVYVIGFSLASTPNSTVLSLLPNAYTGSIRDPQAGILDPSAVANYCPFGVCTTDATGFDALAIGNLDGDPTLDIWRISEGVLPVHLVDDLTD